MIHRIRTATVARSTSTRAAWTLLYAALAALGGAAPASAQTGLTKYPTKYYTLFTDLPEDGVREAKLRITLMAESYQRRTRDFAGSVDKALPFYLYRDAKDYYAAGGEANSLGVFRGDRLLAIADPARPDVTWHTVQHEGFHQFVHATIRGEVPAWANEGLAEYFGEGQFTGDEFLTGFVPPPRLARIKAALQAGRFQSLRKMLNMPQEIWNTYVTAAGTPQMAMEAGLNYDQAWSMVHFLAHADDGRYQKPFSAFLRDVSRGTRWEKAWDQNMGRDVEAFEQRWREYWTGLPDDPTAELYAAATVSTLAGFFARAFSQRQTFENADAFLAAAAANELKTNAEDWLPPGLLKSALQRAPQAGKWSVLKQSGRRGLVCELPDGTRLEGTFKIEKNRVQSVQVERKPAKPGRK